MVWGTKAINPLETSWTSKEGFPKLVYRTPSLYSLWSHTKIGTSKSTARTILENVTPGVLHVQERPKSRCFISVPESWTEGFWYQVPAPILRAWKQSWTCCFLAGTFHIPNWGWQGHKKQWQPELFPVKMAKGWGRGQEEMEVTWHPQAVKMSWAEEEHPLLHP